jgi:hypothetical protein
LKTRGFRKLSVCPKQPEAVEASQQTEAIFSGILCNLLPEHAKAKPIEIWFQDGRGRSPGFGRAQDTNELISSARLS